MDSQNLKYNKGILPVFLEKEKANKKDLAPYAIKINTIDNILDPVKKDGSIIKKQDILNIIIHDISLIPRGNAVFKKFKEIYDLVPDQSSPKETITINLPKEINEQIIRIIKKDEKEESEEEFEINAVKEKIYWWKKEYPHLS